MATRSCDGNTNVSHSSIALLQERFRQLQKAKEMREEKELLRLLSESGTRRTNIRAESYEQTGMLFNSEAGHINNPHRSQTQQQGSMFQQQPKFEMKHGNLKGNEIPIFGNMFSTSTTATSSVMQYYRTNNIDDDDDDDNGSEVDTSLRL
ncbi:hypothetical protein FEM48_Zijuj01G0246200 [Ziziphus jujuba var. spinosa]|uniref:Uncharacterized protein n=1 Tax=Ziziphus jujuba var. spinosa TaxID=714518 RepID=A0A978W4I0_ZIZJJ|nr:hypothetical protein FEM48_Zijuj01G0246200 [Ziziphus jujuba var. spinosa]